MRGRKVRRSPVYFEEERWDVSLEMAECVAEKKED